MENLTLLFLKKFQKAKYNKNNKKDFLKNLYFLNALSTQKMRLLYSKKLWFAIQKKSKIFHFVTEMQFGNCKYLALRKR